jgi:hypothetical protein
VKQAEIDRGERRGTTTERRAELARLHRENRSLREDFEVLQRATGFLAWWVGSFLRHPTLVVAVPLVGRSTSI